MISPQGTSKLTHFTLIISTICVLLGIMCPSYSASSDFFEYLEVSLAGGPNWFNTHDTELVISPCETDSVKINPISTNGAWKVGIGYYLFDEQLNPRSFLNQLLFEFNVYHISNTLHGSLWQFGLPQFNDYTFEAPISSTRWMLDAKPGLLTWHQFSLYPILGVGVTQNKMAYHEILNDVGVDPSCVLILNKHSSNQVAWDLGAGILFPLTNHISLVAEYVYAFLGHGSAANGTADGLTFSNGPSLSFQTQSLLFGLSLTI